MLSVGSLVLSAECLAFTVSGSGCRVYRSGFRVRGFLVLAEKERARVQGVGFSTKD